MGREFIELFDRWSEDYDKTVTGHDIEYKEVFKNYDAILDAVAARAKGTVVEFGVGTGNLTVKLLSQGRKVYGIEPSAGMREQIGKRELDVVLLDGDFLQFPELPEQVDTIVSTYAFHHLTDEEKEQAIAAYESLLGENGKIVFADTAFRHAEDRQQTEVSAEKAGYLNLLHDLQTEYYTTLDILDTIFTKYGFSVTFSKLNRFVWLMEAVKHSDGGERN